MATESNRVLIEIMTAANLAGVEQAQKSFLGLSASTVALGAVLFGAIEVGKAAIQNYEAQAAAHASLAQAVDTYNAQVGKSIPPTKAQADAIEKATESLDAEKRQLAEFDAAHTGHVATVSGGMSKLDAMHRQDIQNQIAGARTTAQREAAQRRLAEFDVAHEQQYHAATGLSNVEQMRREDIVAKVAKAQAALTTAQKDGAHATITHAINLDDLNNKTEEFIQKNKGYIDNQYEAKTAAAQFVRAGNDENDTLRLLNDTVDLAAIKHESLAEAADSLVKAEAGNSKGLRDLGITAAEVSSIMNSHLSTEQKHAALLDLIETKTKKGRDSVTDLEQSQHKLNTDWQDFTARLGPGVVLGIKAITDAADTGVQILDLLDQALIKIGDDGGPGSPWANLQNTILAAAGNPYAIGAIYGDNVGPQDYSSNAHIRGSGVTPGLHKTTNNVTVNVSSTADPQTIARTVGRVLRQLGAD